MLCEKTRIFHFRFVVAVGFSIFSDVVLGVFAIVSVATTITSSAF